MSKMFLGSPGHDFISDISVYIHDVRAGVKPSTWLPPDGETRWDLTITGVLWAIWCLAKMKQVVPDHPWAMWTLPGNVRCLLIGSKSSQPKFNKWANLVSPPWVGCRTCCTTHCKTHVFSSKNANSSLKILFFPKTSKFIVENVGFPKNSKFTLTSTIFPTKQQIHCEQVWVSPNKPANSLWKHCFHKKTADSM